jgi:HlyD family secretion protein
MIKNVAQRVVPLLVLGGAAVGLWWLSREQKPDVFRHLQGVVEMDDTVLSFEVGGRIAGLAVSKGDRVKAGQRIASLDDSLARATVAARQEEALAAEQQLRLLTLGARPAELRALAARIQSAKVSEDLLEKSARRTKSLLDGQAVPVATYEEVTAQRDRAMAEREALEFNLRNLKDGARAPEIAGTRARAAAANKAVELELTRLQKHELFAPRAGEIVELPREVGEVVAAGTPVATLTITGRPYVDVFVPQAHMGGIHLGSKAQVRIDAMQETLPGQVTEIGRRTEFTPRYLFSEAERSTFVVRVRVTIDDPKEKLVVGVPAFVELERGGA